MALINCDFFSESLGINTSITVILPQKTGSGMIGMAGNSSGKTTFPVLYLLHGLSDDHTIWLRRTSIERYVSAMDLAVVMPNVHRSFYTDMKFGGKYWTFVSEELPQIVAAFFPVSTRREDTFAAGLSMGGYGALKLGLRRPDRFAAVASLSGATDIANAFTLFPDDFRLIFGDATSKGTDDDLFHLAEEVMHKKPAERPRLFQYCGTEDFLYEDNVRFRDHLRKIGCECVYREKPGTHDWQFWDETIQEVLAWLPLNR